MNSSRKYETVDSRVLYVAEDWLEPGMFRTFWNTANGSIRRVSSSDLPPRESFELAQIDLDNYAAKNRFPEVDE